MKISGSANKISTWFQPLLIVALATLAMAGCKDSAVQGSSGSSGGGSPGGGMPSPGGGMPSPGGGMPSPGGGMPSPGGGMPSPGGGMPSPGGSQGDGPSGSPGGSSGGETGDGGSGEVGSVPPPPGQGGGGDMGGGESGGGGDSDGGQSGSGGGEDNPFSDAEGGESESECGDTGGMPGGIGGMGREGECISDESASESDSESESSSGGGSSGGGGASGGGSSGGGAGSVGEFPEESATERAERLGRELDESIGGFDETLGQEQREIAAAGRVVDGFDTDGGGGEGSGGTISLGSQTAPTNPDGGMPGTGSGVQTSPIAGMSQDQIQERTPDDVPMTVNDDIIARQLREAALVEEDPDLRARLWDEYRKYKGLLVAD